MSKEVADKIASGLKDVFAYVEGDETAGRIVHPKLHAPTLRRVIEMLDEDIRFNDRELRTLRGENHPKGSLGWHCLLRAAHSLDALRTFCERLERELEGLSP